SADPDVRRTDMYGTVAKTRVKPENREALQKLTAGQDYASVPGYVSSYVLYENDSDAAWLVAIFDDRASYDKNADDPAQHERYVEYRALLEERPEGPAGHTIADR